ncbi:MAG: serine/threonine protein kinase [Burkholderiales bacterium PBB3]|nr:MAG: serine/threonine protein kinase [Burkholderiales bacterium PBB3]
MIDPQGAETGPAYQTLGHVDALPAGTMLGEFEIQGLLGFGGFGMVYRGYDHSLQRAVAIKEYMPSALVARTANHELSARSATDSQTFQSGLNSFIAEARLLARFDHPSLVKVYRFWEANNTAYMAMPLYQGITLKQARLQMSGPPPEDWLRVVLWSVLEALKVLHSSDALHRDVSPDNIFLQDTGPPVLLDLGAARLAVMEGNKKHTAVLKVNYAPIEQYADASDLREGPWTDIYALAAVVHGCVCNEAPLPATFRVVRDRLPTMAKIAKTTETHFGQSYSSSFIKAIDYALAVQPGDRPQSVEAFAKALKLRSVSRPQRFDWRIALGDKVSLSAGAASASSAVFGASATVDETIPFDKQPKTPKVQPITPKVRSPNTENNRTRPVWLLPGGLIAGLFLLLAAVWKLGVFGGFADAPSAANTMVMQTQVVDVATPPRAIEPSASAPEEVFIDVSAPAAKASDASSVQQRAPKLSRPAVASTKPQEEQKAGTPKSAVEKASEPHQKEELVISATASGPSNPKREAPVLCGDSNLFTKPMCIYRECQKPEYANLQVCIEDKKRWEERDRARQP